jgi:hypothetical protein
MATIAVFLALGGGAYAVGGFVGSDGQIHACVTSKGKLTIARAGESCPRHQTQIAWNQRGLPGGNGAPGGTSGPGPKGDKGDQGEQGKQGVTGPAGPTEGTAADFYTNNSTTKSADAEFDQSNFTTSRPGKLFVTKFIDVFTPQCNGGLANIFLFVDSVRVPGSLITSISSGTTLRGVALTGVTPTTLASGSHIASIGLDCGGQSTVGTVVTRGAGVMAVVLG